MKTITLFAATLALGAACKKEKEEAPAAAPMGSATMAAGNGSSALAIVPKPLTAEDMVKRVHECAAFWNAGKWDDLQRCYTTDAGYEAPGGELPLITGSAAIVELAKSERAAFPDQKAEDQLLLVNGKRAVALTLVTGRNTGALKLPLGELPASYNTVGFFRGQVLYFDDTGKIAHEADFYDIATELGQLKPTKEHPVRPAMDKLAFPAMDLIGKDDATEKANLAAFQQLTDHFNKHDAKGVGELIAEDGTWSEQPRPKDLTKNELIAELPTLWKGFSDLKFAVADARTAGDYVAAQP